MTLRYATLDEEYLDGAISAIAASFVLDEPLVKALNIGLEEFLPIAEQACVKALEDKLSKIALNEEGNVVAVLISYDLKNVPEIKAPHRFNPIFGLLEELNKGVNFGDSVLYQFMIGVVDGRRGRNYAGGSS